MADFVNEMKEPDETGVRDTVPAASPDELSHFFGKEAETVINTGGVEATLESPAIEVLETKTPIEEKIYEEPKIEAPVVTGQENIPTDVPTVFDEAEVNRRVQEQVAVEVQKFKHIDTFFEEYQKDPYAFMAKNSPHLFEKFNEQDFIQNKLNEEFGEFRPDPNKVWEYGTPDFQFRERVQELTSQARNYKIEAQSTISNQQNEQTQNEQSFKANKAKELGMDSTTFETKVWNKLKGMDSVSALSALVDAVLINEKLNEKDRNIKEQINLTKGAPSPTAVTSTGVPAEDAVSKVLKKMFADD